MQIDAIGEPFNIVLDTEIVPLKQLDPPLPALCFRIRDKQIEAKGFGVLLTHLSRKEGKLRLTGGMNVFAVFEELRLYIFDQEVLAKVTAIENQDVITVRFTSQGSAIQEFIDRG
jgi:hypothetical protein